MDETSVVKMLKGEKDRVDITGTTKVVSNLESTNIKQVIKPGTQALEAKYNLFTSTGS